MLQLVLPLSFFLSGYTVFMATDLPPFNVTCQYQYAKLHTNTIVVQRSQNSVNQSLHTCLFVWTIPK